MKKLIFGIFAHPDDEAFGPAGTLLKKSRDGYDLHLICATDGAAGINCDNAKDLGALRTKEWQAAGRAFGAKSMLQLGFKDGTLNNCQFHKLAKAIESHVTDTCFGYNQPVEVSFMTFDNTGISGHLDHIAISMIASYIFCRMKESSIEDVYMDKIWYFCLPQSVQRHPDTSFVYMPEGRKKEEISQVVDVSEVLDEKIAVMRLHHSQRGDAENVIKSLGENISKECFVVKS